MKELKAKIIDIHSARRGHHYSQPEQLEESFLGVRSHGIACFSLGQRESKLSLPTGIKPLQPQIAQESQSSQCENSWQQLATQAQRINKLAAQLEAAMLELKAIAAQINCERHIQHNTTKTLGTACEFLAAIVPEVKRNKAGGFILANRKVDLFRAEREATQVAQTLRWRTNRKRLVSHLSRYKRRFFGWLL
jgi:hypothetical protein